MATSSGGNDVPPDGIQDSDKPHGNRKRAGEGLVQDSRRRRAMTEVARRRAAHFAHYEMEEDEGGDGTQSLQARELGPWSSAYQLVRARAAAASAREDKIKRSGQQQKCLDVDWQPTFSQMHRKGLRSEVRTLFDTTLEVVCQYIDCVKTLYGLPDDIKVQLARMVCCKRKLSPEVCRMFVADGPNAVVLLDCTQIDQETMKELLKSCATSRLEHLELGLCGRGLGDNCAKMVYEEGFLGNLQSLVISGAYQLSDTGLESILSATVCQLHVLELQMCSRLSGSVLYRLQELCPNLRSLDLQDCRGVGGEALQESLVSLTNLTSLNLSGIPEVTDDILFAVVTRCPLTRIGLNQCGQLTDSGIIRLAEACPNLVSLSVDKVGKLTDLGITSVSDNCRTLKELSLQNCMKVTDVALAAVAACGTLQKFCMRSLPHAGIATMEALALYCSNSLLMLDVSFCRGVTENSLGLVADSCCNLRKMTVFGCSHISNKLIHGHSNSGLKIEGLGTVRAN